MLFGDPGVRIEAEESTDISHEFCIAVRVYTAAFTDVQPGC